MSKKAGERKVLLPEQLQLLMELLANRVYLLLSPRVGWVQQW